MASRLAQAIIQTSQEIGANPAELATVISYETGGTFDEWKAGPRTQWGQHRGLIQWGEPQRQKYGVFQGMPVEDQVKAAGRYLQDAGFRPGMGILDMYSAINAGRVGRYNASDANNGGAPGTVRDKVQGQMAGHRKKAQALLDGLIDPSSFASSDTLIGSGGDDNITLDTIEVKRPSYVMDEPLRPESLWIQDPGAFDTSAPQEPQGALQGALDAIGEQQTLSWMWDSISDRTKVDPDFTLNEVTLSEALKANNLDAEFYAPWFTGARSEGHFKSLLESAIEDRDRAGRLDEMGATGTAMRIASAILDPVAIGAEVLSAGAASAVVGGSKFIQVGRVLSGALGGAAGGAAASGVQAAFNPRVGASDVALDAVLGAGLGSVIGKLSGSPGTRSEAMQLQRVYLPEPERPLYADGSLSAARNPAVVMPVLDNPGIRSITDADAPKTFLGALRMDVAGRLKASDNPAARLLLGSLSRDAAGSAEDVVQGFSRTEDTDRIFRSWNLDLMHTYNPQLKAFREAQKASGTKLSSGDIEALFHDQIDLFVRDRDAVAADFHPAVVAMATKIRKLHREALADAKNPMRREGKTGRSVAGFEALEDNPHYMMRVFDAQKVANFRDRFGDNGLERLIAVALKGAGHEMADAKVLAVAKGFSRAIRDRALGLQELDPVNLSEDGFAALRKVLLEESGIEEVDIDAILSPLKRSTGTSGTPRGKSRMMLDETAKARVASREGLEQDVSLRDLIVTDALALSTKYLRQIAGQVSMARWQVFHPRTGELLVNGATNRAEFEAALTAVDRYGIDAKVSASQRKADAKRARYLYDHITGRAVDPLADEQLGEWLRVVQAVNYSRLMGQVGFAQIPELAGVVTRLGIKASFSHMPAFRRIITTDTGEQLLENGFARDVETFLSAGVDRFSRMDFHRTDDLSGDPHSLHRGSLANKALDKANRLNRVTSTLSGMDLVTSGLERIAGSAIIQRFVDAAHGVGKLSGPWRRQMGLSDLMTERVLANLRDPRNVTTSPGALTGQKVQRLRMDWEDKEAFAAFQDAALRISKQLIQRNDPGMMAMWMTPTLGSIIMQFRKFSFAAFTNNLLFNANLARRGDMRAMNYFLMSSMFAATVYAVQEKVRAIGRSDQDEYLERRLSWDSIAKSSFARSGYSSILPMMLDSPPVSFFTGGGLFDFRSSGQPSAGWTSNPTLSLLDDIQKGARGVLGPSLDDREMTQEDARALMRVLPLGNTLPAVIGLSTLTRGLDERTPLKYRD